MGSLTSASRPLILVTLGDPAGVGPEIVLKALAQPRWLALCHPVGVGDLWVAQEVSRRLQLQMDIRPFHDSASSSLEVGKVELIDVKTQGIAHLVPGRPQPLAARSAVASLRTAVRLAVGGLAHAIVTAPINKEALRLGGYPWIGHTEMLQDMTGSPKSTTLFITGSLRIFFATRHLPLRQAIELLKKPFLFEAIMEANLCMRGLGFPKPRLVVAGLNPHAGDGGLFGREEIDEIEPAVRQAQKAGIQVDGPVPADAVFHRCIAGFYDAVIALTHDQGHIAAKTLDFYRTVSVTLGLPFVRTSVDHGTAFDIAWQGKADPRSLEEAITVATSLVDMEPPGSRFEPPG